MRPPFTHENCRVGSYATLSIDGYRLFETKNYVDPVAMSVFSERDRIAVLTTKDGPAGDRTEPIPLGWTSSDLIELPDETTLFVAYRARARDIAERLEAMGVSLAQVRYAFERRLIERADEIVDAMEDDDVSAPALAQMLRTATFLDWSAAFQDLMADNLLPAWPFTPPEALRTEMMKFIAAESDEGTFFGLPGDARWLLRAVTEVCGPEAWVEYDMSDLVRRGWYDLHQPVAQESIDALRRGARHHAPTIVLTEGSTDAAALEGATRVLSPHLTGYLTFLDFHGSNAAGGAGALVAAVRAFAAAGVLNRAIALFDNDTAGRAALQALRKTRLPESIRIATLPDLPLGRVYPTIGPTGEAEQDVNGRAGSLELYFGADVLRREGGELTPVAWRSYDNAAGAWQGELVDKALLQQRFAAKVKRASEDPSLIQSLDWTGIRLIIECVLWAFADPDVVRPSTSDGAAPTD
jgi:hypothetical protein